MIETEVDLANIRWPDRCAYCNEHANRFVRTISRAVEKVGYWVLFFTYTSRVVELGFPVCRAHKPKAVLASALSQRRLISIGLGVLTAFAMLGAIADLYRLFYGADPYEFGWTKTSFLYFFPVLYWSVFYWARKSAPVLIQDVDGKIILHFKNDEFGREFIRINEAE